VLAETARQALLACGYVPTVQVGDGAVGHPSGGPYDRILATCSPAMIPPPWLDQLRPGGMLLTGLHRDLGGGALVLLHRDGHAQAQGRFLAGYGGFMPVRTDPPADATARLTTALAVPAGQATRMATVGPDVVDHPDFGMLAALRLPGVASVWFEPDTGPQFWLLGDDGSFARLQQGTAIVAQHGGRRLWDELERLHHRWCQAGQPARHRYGLTVTDTGEHRFWLDDPREVWWTSQPR